MSSLINSYIDAAKAYQNQYELRSNNQTWIAYKSKKERLVSLIDRNQREARAQVIPLLKTSSENPLKFVRIQEKTLSRRSYLTPYNIRCEADVAYCPNLSERSISIIKTVPMDKASQFYQVEDDLIAEQICVVKVIGKADARMCIHSNDNPSDLEEQVARTYMLYQDMSFDPVCQNYRRAKEAFRVVCKKFYKNFGNAGLFIENAPEALEKAQKWGNQFKAETVDLEDYLNAIAEFEEAYEERSDNDSYLKYKLEVRILAEAVIAEVVKNDRHIVLPASIEGTLLSRLIEKHSLHEDFEVSYSEEAVLNPFIKLQMMDVQKTYDALHQDPCYIDYQRCKLALQELVSKMKNPNIVDGVSVAYAKINKWKA